MNYYTGLAIFNQSCYIARKDAEAVSCVVLLLLWKENLVVADTRNFDQERYEVERKKQHGPLEMRIIKRSEVERDQALGRVIYGFCMAGPEKKTPHDDYCCWHESYHPNDTAGIARAGRALVGW